MSKEIPIPGTLVSSDEVDLSKFSIHIEDTELWDEVKIAMSHLINFSSFKNADAMADFITTDLQKHYTITRKK